MQGNTLTPLHIDPDHILHSLEGQKDWSVPGWPQFIAAPITADKHLAQPVTTEDEFVYWGH